MVTLTVTDASGSVTRAWVVSSHTANQAPSTPPGRLELGLLDARGCDCQPGTSSHWFAPHDARVDRYP